MAWSRARPVPPLLRHVANQGAPTFDPQSATTDQFGRFEYKRVPLGRDQVRVSYQGLESAIIDVVIGAQPLAPLQPFPALRFLHLHEAAR